MKKISRVSLNRFSNNELEDRQKHLLRGGSCSGNCGCCYDGNWHPDYYGGSSHTERQYS